MNALRFRPAFVGSRLFGSLPLAELLPELTLEVDSIAEGVDSVGVEWHVQCGSSAFPLGRGLSQASVDPATGKIVGYRTLEEQLAKVMRQAAELEAKAAAGEDVAEELEKRRAQVQKLVDAGITPAAEPAAAAPAADAAAPAAS